MRKDYMTVLNEASAEYNEKKSRFIASVRPAATEEDAIAFLNTVKSMHREARHNVYAYCIGGGVNIQRYSDDGEPAGTGGIPVLEVIKKSGLEDIIVVVTRYFGGILLGTGGLARAYGKSAAMGIEASKIVRKVLCREVLLRFEYNQLGKIQGALADRGFHTGETIYEDSVKLKVYAKEEELDMLIAVIKDITGGTASINLCGSTYITIDAK